MSLLASFNMRLLQLFCPKIPTKFQWFILCNINAGDEVWVHLPARPYCGFWHFFVSSVGSKTRFYTVNQNLVLKSRFLGNLRSFSWQLTFSDFWQVFFSVVNLKKKIFQVKMSVLKKLNTKCSICRKRTVLWRFWLPWSIFEIDFLYRVAKLRLTRGINRGVVNVSIGC